MGDDILLRTIVKMLTPFIFMFGLYVQFHGEYSPGGGFQAGVICAAAFISHALINGLNDLNKIISERIAMILSCLGLILYGGVGVVALIKGGNFLNYSVLSHDPVSGQKLGIIIIEAGVGLTVFSVIMLVFFVFAKRGA